MSTCRTSPDRNLSPCSRFILEQKLGGDVSPQPEQGSVLPGSSPHITTPEAEVLSRLTDVLSQHNSPGNGAAIVRELKLLLPQLERLEGPPCHQAQLTLSFEPSAA